MFNVPITHREDYSLPVVRPVMLPSQVIGEIQNMSALYKTLDASLLSLISMLSCTAHKIFFLIVTLNALDS